MFHKVGWISRGGPTAIGILVVLKLSIVVKFSAVVVAVGVKRLAGVQTGSLVVVVVAVT